MVREIKEGGVPKEVCGDRGFKHLHPVVETVRAGMGVTGAEPKELDTVGAAVMPAMAPGSQIRVSRAKM